MESLGAGKEAVQGLGFGGYGLRLRVLGLGFEVTEEEAVEGLGFRIYGLGFRV